MRFRRLAGSLALGFFALLLAAGSARGLSLEAVGSFAKPVYVTSDPGDADRLFVVERQGTIVEVESGTITPYVDLTSLVDSSSGERAMASIAFDPDFATSGKLYVVYTAKAGAEHDQGDIVVEELTEPEDLENPFPRPSPQAEGLVSILVSARPCAGDGGRTVLLRRGGKPNGGKLSDDDCSASFARRVHQRSTFRAMLSPRPGEVLVRSRRLTVPPQ